MIEFNDLVVGVSDRYHQHAIQSVGRHCQDKSIKSSIKYPLDHSHHAALSIETTGVNNTTQRLMAGKHVFGARASCAGEPLSSCRPIAAGLTSTRAPLRPPHTNHSTPSTSHHVSPVPTLIHRPITVVVTTTTLSSSVKSSPPSLPSSHFSSPNIASYADHLYLARRPPPDVSSSFSHSFSSFPSFPSTSVNPPSPMPRPLPPPTPGSSSDIRGKEGNSNAPTFNLPPTAFHEVDRASNASSAPSNNGSDSSYHPVSPGTSTQNSRKRPVQPAMSVITKDDFSLPPPPTRSRKIIQMKPKDAEQEAAQQASSANTSGKASNNTTQTTGGKKNSGKSTTAAGRKIARKTAHSLIERRRRSKMNEEFGVLKDMIPACQGQDMHKLAILSVCLTVFKMHSLLSDNQFIGRHRLSPLPRTMRDGSTSTKQQFATPSSSNRTCYRRRSRFRRRNGGSPRT